MIVVMTSWSCMPIISCADFAVLAGVSRSAISQAAKPKDGKPPKLALEKDGTINTDLPINAAYLTDKREGKKRHAEKPVAPKPPKPPRDDTVSPLPLPPEDPDEDDLEGELQLAAEKLKYTVAKRIQAEADTRLKNLKEARDKEILIPRELVRRKFAAFDATLKSNFRDMPRRISAQVTALGASEGQAAVERYLEEQISAAITRAVDEAKKLGLL